MPKSEFYTEPTKEELRDFSKEKFADKRAELAGWLKELREMQRTDPEKAKSYIPPRELLNKFYDEMEEVYEDLPLDKEKIEMQFSAENLSNLDMNGYVALLRKVPPRLILHITRQGVRDRASFHSGRGQVSHGFENILSNGKISSVLERCLEGVITKESVRNTLANYLRIPEDFPTRKDATERVEEFLTGHATNNLVSSEVADVSALHVSMDYVMSEEYGAERGNDIFFAYPTAFVASQYKIAAQWGVPEEFDMIKSTMSGQFNDLWIKAKKNNSGSMPLDAAVTFIPANARVDRETGSKYNIDSEGVPMPNAEQINKIKSFLVLPEARERWGATQDALHTYQDSTWELSRKKMEGRDTEKIFKLEAEVANAREIIEAFLQIAREHGITDPRFHATLLDSSHIEHSKLAYLLSLCTKDDPFKGMNDFEVNDKFDAAGLTFELADEKNVTTSKAYWEDYFERIGKRPSKIVFYEEATPNEALTAFKERTGLARNSHEGVDLKNIFAENVLGRNKQMHEMMSDEISLFAQYANEVIDETYPAN